MAAEVALAAEGALDLAILRRLCDEAGLTPGPEYAGRIRTGKQRIDPKLGGWAAAAAVGGAFLVLRDLDADAPCAGALRARLLTDPTPPLMCFRIAVRQAEAWPIADRANLLDFLLLRDGALRAEPETIADAKAALIEAARASRSRRVRAGLPPRPGSGLKTGDAYVSTLEAFARDAWSPAAAATRSPSLAAARRRIAELAARLGA